MNEWTRVDSTEETDPMFYHSPQADSNGLPMPCKQGEESGTQEHGRSQYKAMATESGLLLQKLEHSDWWPGQYFLEVPQGPRLAHTYSMPTG